MALKDIKQSYVERIEEYAWSYEWIDFPGAGFYFDCDKDGNIFEDRLEAPALENLRFCRENVGIKVIERGLVDFSHNYRHPAEGTCVCGRTVVLYADYGHGIDCDCGRIYNMSGQELAPRSQWEDYYDEDSTQPYNIEFGYSDRDDY